MLALLYCDLSTKFIWAAQQGLLERLGGAESPSATCLGLAQNFKCRDESGAMT